MADFRDRKLHVSSGVVASAPHYELRWRTMICTRNLLNETHRMGHKGGVSVKTALCPIVRFVRCCYSCDLVFLQYPVSIPDGNNEVVENVQRGAIVVKLEFQ